MASSPPQQVDHLMDDEDDDMTNTNDHAASSQHQGGLPRSSSPPLNFPSSSVAGTPKKGKGPANGGSRAARSTTGMSSPFKGLGVGAGVSSPLAFPSSDAGTPRASRMNDQAGSGTGNTPSRRAARESSAFGGRRSNVPTSSARQNQALFYSSDAGGSTPGGPRSTRHPARGDINSTVGSPSFQNRRQIALPISSSQQQQQQAARSRALGGGPSPPPSSEPLNPTSSAAPFSGLTSDVAATEGGDPDGLERVIWGTNINIAESLTAFCHFIRTFKPKYRREYDRKQAALAAESSNLPNPSASAFAGAGASRYNPLDSAADRERDEEPLYVHYLRLMRLTNQTNLNLDTTNLLAHKDKKVNKLYYQLCNYPAELVPVMDTGLMDMMIEVAAEDQAKGDESMQGDLGEEEIRAIPTALYKVRPFGAEKMVNMRDLNPNDTDKLVCIKGLVIRATPVIPDMKSAFFRCLVCQHTLDVEIEMGKIAEPTECPREVCQSKGSMSLIHNRCKFANKQVVRLQETPDAVPDGQTPHTVSLCAYDELVDLTKPGDRVLITGIFRSIPVRVNPRNRSIKALFKTFVDVVHVKRTNTTRMGYDPATRQGEAKPPGVGVGGEEDEGEELMAARNGRRKGRGRKMDDDEEGFEEEDDEEDKQGEMERKLEELSRREDVYELLSRSLAPSIWEMDDVKKGILLQLFGGTNKSIAKGGGGGGPRYRGDINVLLVGDPGTSKSQILGYVHKIAPRGVYTSGKGSSAVGLTAYITRDPDSKQLVLESGALVLSDGGVCCIDEFDKMSDATRSVLHEVMEQQTVSIAKAGIITTLNARTSILAAANPVGSKYNPKWPITKNIDLPPTLISRFDLLYLVLDKIDESMDRRLAKHLVGLYLEDRPETGGLDILPVETLTAYITYARSKIHPVLTEEASNALVSAYVAMRKVGEDPRSSERRITATTRQLESMIRLSEAHARMRFSETVDEEDVKEAGRLIREAIRESATDPVTGQIDLDLINTGAGQQQRRLATDLKRALVQLLDSSPSGPRGIKWADAIKKLEEQSSVSIDNAEFADVVKTLEHEGALKVSGARDQRVIKKLSD